MKLTANEVFLAKCALRVLEGAGGVGVSEEVLLDQVAISSERLLTRVERRALLSVLIERDWMYAYTEPLTGCKRWVLSEDGQLALRAL